MLWIVNTNLDIYVCITITSLIHLLVDYYPREHHQPNSQVLQH